MSSKAVSRIPAFDIVKCFAIFLVIYGHTIQHYSSMDRLENWAYLFVYSFHMPLFMAISGYFSLSSFRIDFKTFAFKKLKQLIVPVVSFAILMTLWFAFLEHRFVMSPWAYFLSFVTQFNTWLWFLRSLAICYLLAYIGEGLPAYRWLYYVAVISTLMFVDYCNLAMMFPCFTAGLWLRRRDFIAKYSNWQTLLTAVLLFVALYACFDKYLWSAPSVNSVCDILPLMLQRTYRIVMGLSGATVILVGIKIMTDNYKSPKIYDAMTSVGQQTLALYVVQCLVVEIAFPIIAPPIQQNIQNQWVGNIAIFPLMATIFLCICLLVINMLHRFKLVKYLLFGQ